MAKTSAKKKYTVNLDEVEGRVLVPEGEYHLKIASGEVKEGNEFPYINWKMSIIDEDKKLNGQSIYYVNSLSPQSLWNLKNLMLTCGIGIPKGDVDPEDIIEAAEGGDFMGTIEHEDYEGKARARLTDFVPFKEEETVEVEDDEPEETPAPKARAKKAAPVEEDDEEEEDEPPAKKGKKAADDDDDEEKLTEAEIKEMDEDELKGLVKKLKLKVDLDAIPRTTKKVAAVLDALEAKGLLA